MVLTLGMTLELRAVEIYLSEIACAVSFRLIIEVRRRWIAALSASRHGPGTHSLAELNDRHKAVAAGAVNLLRPFVRTRGERSQRAPNRRSETDRNARAGVAEWMHDVVGETLEAIDIAPRRSPRSEVGREFVRCC